MKKKAAIMSANLTEKNRLYLSMLGIIDNRTGKSRDQGPKASRFINECITLVCESGMHPLQRMTGTQATSEELRTAWINIQITEKTKEVDRLNKEIFSLSKSKKTEVVLNEETL